MFRSITALTALLLSPIALIAVVLVALLAWLPAEEATPLSSGTYASDAQDAGPSDALALDIGAGTFAATSAEGQVVAGTLTPAGPDYEVRSCLTVSGSTVSAAYFLEVPAIALNGQVVHHPVVSTVCGSTLVVWDRREERSSIDDLPIAHVALDRAASAPTNALTVAGL